MSALITLTNSASPGPARRSCWTFPASISNAARACSSRPSGSGKTTLLGLLGGVQKPGRGSIRLLGEDLEKLSAARRDHFRVDHTGYIFQQFNLLPFLRYARTSSCPVTFPRCAVSAPANATVARRRPPAICSASSASAANCTNAAPTACPSASSSGSPPPAR